MLQAPNIIGFCSRHHPQALKTNSTPACMPKQLLTRPHKVLSAAAAYIWVAQRASQADAVPGCFT